MGLDMYAFKMKAKEAGDSQTMDSWSDDIEREEIAYWRKFNHLHGWMEALYREKGGDKLDFNCVYVRLEQADLDRLKDALDKRKLKHTPGFFFGTSEWDDLHIIHTEEFIQNAKQALLDGDAVFYYSWW
jgi:hypothetical protein